MTDETWQLIGMAIFLWVLSGGTACLLLLLIDTIIPTNVVNHFFMTLDPVIGVLLTFLLGPFSIILPHIYYIPFVYRKWKAIKEKERLVLEEKRKSCGWWELKEFGGKY